jgi:uncharacterized coiled-coil protein SlyX
MPVNPHEHLAEVDHRITAVEARISRQNELIATLTEKGQNIALAERLMEALQSSLTAFGEIRKTVVWEIGREATWQQPSGCRFGPFRALL